MKQDFGGHLLLILWSGLNHPMWIMDGFLKHIRFAREYDRMRSQPNEVFMVRSHFLLKRMVNETQFYLR